MVRIGLLAALFLGVCIGRASATDTYHDTHVLIESGPIDDCGQPNQWQQTVLGGWMGHYTGITFSSGGGGCAAWQDCGPTGEYGAGTYVWIASHSITVGPNAKMETKAHLDATGNFSACGFIMGRWQCVGGNYPYSMGGHWVDYNLGCP